jgi:transcriptional regulator with XRE-family HTH domain
LKDAFGKRLRKLRETKRPDLSLRELAKIANVAPAYLSAIERGEQRASDDAVSAIAKALGENPDILLMMGGRVSKHLQELICKRPELWAELIAKIDKMPDHAILRVVREVQDGKW